MKKIIFVLLLFLSNHSFSQISDKLLFDNFKKTMIILNEAFIIINITDLNTNITTEYCTTNIELLIAIEKEYDISKSKAYKKIRKNKNLDFEFKNKEVLNSFKQSYSSEEVDEFDKKNEIEKIIPNINEQWRIPISKTKGDEYLYGYFLTKKGFIIGINYNCRGLDGLRCISCLE